MTAQKKMLLVFNPKAGTQKFKNSLFSAVDTLTAAGFLVTVYPTQAPGGTGRAVAEHAGSYDVVVCSGGDGTIREAADALLRHENRPALGIIPSGSTNDFAASLGIPRDIPGAVGAIIDGAEKALDIGRFGDKHFAYVAAFGLFTEAAYTTSQNSKNALGQLAYLLEGVKQLGTVKSVRCTVTPDGERIEDEFVLGLVTNSRSVGGVKLPKTLDVQTDDGLFEAILMRKPEGLKDLPKITAALNDQEIDERLFVVRKAKTVTFVSEEPVAWTLDGDYGGKHRDVTIENLRRAVRVILPQ
jgi:YegS/Rv2252/BmrU family lipid kinase